MSYSRSKLITNPIQSNISGVQFGFSSTTLQIKQESLLYPPSSLFGDIGGSLGLFLGFSLLSFGETALGICKRMINHFVTLKWKVQLIVVVQFFITSVSSSKSSKSENINTSRSSFCNKNFRLSLTISWLTQSSAS